MAVGQSTISSCNLSRGLVRNGRVGDSLGGWLCFGVGWSIVGLCKRLDGGICLMKQLATHIKTTTPVRHGTYKLFGAALQEH